MNKPVPVLSSPETQKRGSESRSAKMTKGFTLIELLTVIAIIGILAAILLPVVSRVRASAVQSKCVSRLRSLGVAAQTFAVDHNEQYPTNGSSNSFGPDGSGRFYVLLKPYVGIDNISNAEARNTHIFNCAVHDGIGDFGARHLYRFSTMVGMRNASGTGFNNSLPIPLRLSQATHPERTPYQWCLSGDGGASYLPTPAAAEYGWQGPTGAGGLAPNHNGKCVVLYLSGRIDVVDLSNQDNDLYRDGFPRGNVWAAGSAFDPIR